MYEKEQCPLFDLLSLLSLDQHTVNSIFWQIGDRKAIVDKLNCITTNRASLRIRCGEDLPIKMNNRRDIPWITELEKVSSSAFHALYLQLLLNLNMNAYLILKL